MDRISKKQLEIYKPVLGIFAGFETLCNICNYFPCINIHPGDLTVEKDGERLLTGLGVVPVKSAIINGFDHMKSTIIQVNPVYKFSDMDNGKILDISDPVPIDLFGVQYEKLIYNDALFEEISKFNLYQLKINGDHKIYPKYVDSLLEKMLNEN